MSHQPQHHRIVVGLNEERYKLIISTKGDAHSGITHTIAFSREEDACYMHHLFQEIANSVARNPTQFKFRSVENKGWIDKFY